MVGRLPGSSRFARGKGLNGPTNLTDNLGTFTVTVYSGIDSLSIITTVSGMTPNEHYKVRLEDIFEGPMELLVHLIKKHEVDIYDIPIALITKQYLEYLEWMKAMNIDMAGDFLVMASTLAQIKSRMLIPAHENENDDEDPRLELVRPLEEYLRMKSAAERLSERDLLGEDTFVRNPAPGRLFA